MGFCTSTTDIVNKKKKVGKTGLTKRRPKVTCPLCSKQIVKLCSHLQAKSHNILDPDVLLSYKPNYRTRKCDKKFICNLCKVSVTRYSQHLRQRHKLTGHELKKESANTQKVLVNDEFFKEVLKAVKRENRKPVVVSKIIDNLSMKQIININEIIIHDVDGDMEIENNDDMDDVEIIDLEMEIL